MRIPVFVVLALCGIAVAGVCVLTGCSSSSPSGADDTLEANLTLTTMDRNQKMNQI